MKQSELKLTERQIEQQIVDVLEAHGWRVLRTNKFGGAVILRQGSIEPGIPDLMARRPCTTTGCAPRAAVQLLVWIEVKRPGETLNKNQRRWWAAHPDEEKVVATGPDNVKWMIGSISGSGLLFNQNALVLSWPAVGTNQQGDQH